MELYGFVFLIYHTATPTELNDLKVSLNHPNNL